MNKGELEKELLSLVLNAKMGDKKSYRTLLTKLGKLTESFLYNKIIDPEDREECVQDVLMAIHVSLSGFDNSKRFLPWYFSIVRFKTIDHLKRIYKEKSLKKENIEDYSNFLTFHSEYNNEESLDLKLLESALESLEPSHRKALELAKIESVPLSEIAIELEWTLSKTKVVIHRSLKKMKKFMEKKYEKK